MIIDNKGKNLFASTPSAKGRVEHNPSAAKSAMDAKLAGAARPEVSLSSQAQLLSKLESKIQSTPAVNSERIAEIRLALANGTYEINAERIASRMLEQDRLL